jgi:hypothetical protein
MTQEVGRMSELSDDAKLNALLQIYDNDRDEERVQSNRLDNVFTTFTLVFLGATNAFMQLESPTVVAWSVLSLSIIVATGLYWRLHNDMTKRILDASKIKEGREILIQSLINGRPVGDYRDNLVRGADSAKELESRINSPAYPFVALLDIVRSRFEFDESRKKCYVIATGVLAILLAGGYCYFA